MPSPTDIVYTSQTVGGFLFRFSGIQEFGPNCELVSRDNSQTTLKLTQTTLRTSRIGECASRAGSSPEIVARQFENYATRVCVRSCFLRRLREKSVVADASKACPTHPRPSATVRVSPRALVDGRNNVAWMMGPSDVRQLLIAHIAANVMPPQFLG
jgi:hypothetical protein